MHMPRLLALGVQNVEIVSKELVLWRPVRFGSVLRMFRGRHDRRAFVEISTSFTFLGSCYSVHDTAKVYKDQEMVERHGRTSW